MQGTITGTAESGVGHVLTAGVPVFANASVFEVTIPAGQTSARLTLTPIFHAASRPRRDLHTAEGTSATVTIADEPAVTIRGGDATAAELGPNTGTFTVTRGGATTYDRFVQARLPGRRSPGRTTC